jgi:hypothetical protein
MIDVTDVLMWLLFFPMSGVFAVSGMGLVWLGLHLSERSPPPDS